MYIAKYLTKIYVCLGSKIPHGKKREQKERARKEKEGTKNSITTDQQFPQHFHVFIMGVC